MRFMKLATCAALAVLALGSPAVADQGYMFSNANQCAVIDHFNLVGSVGTDLLAAATFDQEVLLSGDSTVVDNELRALPPASGLEIDTSPNGRTVGNLNAIYDLSGDGHFKGSVILKLGHAAPANHAGNPYTIEHFDTDIGAARQLKI